MLQKNIIKSQSNLSNNLSSQEIDINLSSPSTISNSTSSYYSIISQQSPFFNINQGVNNSNNINTLIGSSSSTTPLAINNSSSNIQSEYLSFSPYSSNIDHLEMSSDTLSIHNGGGVPNVNSSNNSNNSNVTTPINTVDGADSHQKKKDQTSTSSTPPTPPPQATKPTNLSSSINNNTNTIGGGLSTSSSNEELNWSSLNSKMKQVNKFDAKRGSILIEHLSEYNKLASSQVILGEEEYDQTNSSTSSNGKVEETPINNTTTTTTTSSPINNTTTTTTTTPNNINVQQINQSNFDSIVMSGINLFNEKPKKGIEFFIQHKLLDKSPDPVAEFLHKCPLLDKKSIGDYLGDNDPFAIAALESLIARFTFKDLDFDMALRQLLYCFRLPGEAQKIDRIMQKFANQFYKDNLKSVFEDPDAVYMVAFAIILLNTDVHNPQIKNKMPKSKFAKSLHGINAGKDLPLEYIEDLYDRILSDEIKMEPTAALFPYACKKGWLNIRVKGRVTDKWSRKWCILSDGTLYFFRKPTDTTPVRYLHPDTVITTQKEMKGRKNCFILNHSSPPISLQSAMMIKDHNNPQKYFNPQAIFQQLAAFGKDKKKEPKFWDSISMKYDQKIDINIFNDSFDSDSIGSFDTLSESSNYYDEDISTSSSVNSTSPIHASTALADQQKKKIAFSLRMGNKKTKDQLNEYESEFELQLNQGTNTNSGAHTASTANGSSTPNKPPVPARTHLNVPNHVTNNNISPSSSPNTTNSNTPSPNNVHSLTQPRPTIYKQGSSSLIRSSSISTFSTPTVNVLSASSSATNSSNNSPTSSSGSSGVSTISKSSSETKKTIEDIMKQQEKLIKSSKQQTTVIINADTKREMESWTRLILSQFKNNK